MMIGEIGGPQEAEAAAFAREYVTKPVVGYVAGADGTSRAPDGARRCDYLDSGRQRCGESRDHAGGGLDHGAQSRGAGQHDCRGPRPETRSSCHGDDMSAARPARHHYPEAAGCG